MGVRRELASVIASGLLGLGMRLQALACREVSMRNLRVRRKPGLHISEADIVLQEIQLASATQALPHGCCTD